MLVLVLEFSRISARCSTHARNCHVRNVEGPVVHEWTSTEERRSSKTEDESPVRHGRNLSATVWSTSTRDCCAVVYHASD